jgi:hypothetical protein
MPTPSGQIAFSQVNAELGVSPTSTQANLGSAPFRGLAGVPSGQISMSNLRGKSSFSVTSSGTIATPATGLAPGNGYVYHTFTGPGTFTVNGSKSMEILLVGGGGAGSPSLDSNGGGGGAGGLVYWSSIPLSPGSYTVTIGSGGPGGTNNGGPSVFGPGTPLHLVALGGGYGGRGSSYAASNGGSGGGGGGFSGDPAGGSGIQTTDPTIPANSRTYGFGNPGGSTAPNTADGGGGAGTPGTSPTTPDRVGGTGRQYPNFTGPLIGVPALNPLSGYFSGGGGANHPKGNSGGLGGGGTGVFNAPGTSGVTNSGGGGGGSYSGSAAAFAGGTGGPGICVIRYLA